MKRMVYGVFTAILLLGLIACGRGEESASTWREQYDLGVRYLSEGNYEEAILAFSAAIEIDPKRAPAYVGRGDAYVGYAQLLMEDAPDGAEPSGKALEAYENAIDDYLTALDLDDSDETVYQKAADVYIVLGDTESASELLRKGERITGDRSLQAALDEMTGVIVPGEVFRGSERWTTLESFLSRLTFYGSYNCETATVRTDNEWPRNAMEKLLTDMTDYCYDDMLYPGEIMEDFWEQADPLGKWVSQTNSYTKVNASKLEWILRHIFNCTQADIEKMKKPILAGEDEDIYYLDGYYYFMMLYIGGGSTASVTSVEQRGTRYYVEYNVYDEIDVYDEMPEAWHAVVSLKEIDGREYWSVYSCQKSGDTGREPQQEEQTPSFTSHSAQSVVDILLAHEDMWRDDLMTQWPEGSNFAYFMDMDFDGVPEFIVEAPMMGTGFFTSRTIYQIQGEDLIVVKTGEDEFAAWDDISLWRDRQTGEYFYIGYDFLRGGWMWNTSTWARLDLQHGELLETALFSEVAEFDEAVNDHVSTYYGSDRSTAISETEFELLRADLENRAENLGAQHGDLIEGWNAGASQEEKRSILLTACESAPLFR